MTVGTPRTPYFWVTPGASSMSSLPILYLPANSSASPSTIGARTLHGPHQVAVKSTRTGTADLRTSASKLASVSSITFLPAMVASSTRIRGERDCRFFTMAREGPGLRGLEPSPQGRKTRARNLPGSSGETDDALEGLCQRIG